MYKFLTPAMNAEREFERRNPRRDLGTDKMKSESSAGATKNASRHTKIIVVISSYMQDGLPKPTDAERRSKFATRAEKGQTSIHECRSPGLAFSLGNQGAARMMAADLCQTTS
jgi:hypothetical protein